MNSRNTQNTGTSSAGNRRSLISYLRNFFTGSSNEESSQTSIPHVVLLQNTTPEVSQMETPQTQSSRVQNPRGSSSREENIEAQTRNVVHLFLDRMQRLSSNQRNVLINSGRIRGRENESERSGGENEESEDDETSSRNRSKIYNKLFSRIGRYRFYDELAESYDELLNPQEEDDYIDYRTYPLIIDWQEFENDESEAYHIYEKFGYFGVSAFTSLSKVNKLRLSNSKFIQSFAEFYQKNFSKIDSNLGSIAILTDFINCLPNLLHLRQVIYQGLLSKKELVCIKVVLDIYEHFYSVFDRPFFSKMKEDYIPTSLLFYSTLSDEDVRYIYDTITTDMKAIMDIMSNINIFYDEPIII